LLAALLARQQPPAPKEAPDRTQQLGEVVLSGESIDRSEETGLITVTGNARAERGEDVLRATRLTINPTTRELIAEGNVEIRHADQIFHATRATYNFEKREGQADQAEGKLGNFLVQGRKLAIKAGPDGPKYEFTGVRMTTCDDEHPHYMTYTRSVELTPQQSILARGLGLDLLGMRLLTIPSLRKSLKPSEQSAYPSLGYDRRGGPYIEKQFDVLQNRHALVDSVLRINSMQDPSGGIRVATPGRYQFVGSLYYRDIAENQRARFVQVSRLPEVGVGWSSWREGARPGRFLPHQVSGLARPDYIKYSRNWHFDAQATLGYFRQHPGRTSVRMESGTREGTRASIQAQAVLPLVKVGPISLNDLRLVARDSIYFNGQNHLILGTGIGKEFTLGKFQVGVDRFDQFTSGSTPFLFDDVELRHEWRPRFEYKSNNFNFSYFARLRPEQGLSLFDQVFQVSRRFHCLEPRLVYRVRRQEIGIELRIPGLTGTRRSEVGEPRSSFGPDERESDDAPVRSPMRAPEKTPNDPPARTPAKI
jgi:hypothetical protein